ncbi:STAS domain-containing protein [Streptomyces sp. NPDC086777]|uniref:STAS domain-containing protein n=1 Tax=Streptomyces sp. NPDC086777 TaxID=3154866 RepID=UPI00344F66A2
MRGQTSALAVTGDLDLFTVPVLEHQVGEVLDDHRTVIRDLTGVTFCDSSGLNTLIRPRRRARDAGGRRLVLAAPPPRMMRLLSVTGAEGVFPVHGSLAEAWRAQSAPGTPPTARPPPPRRRSRTRPGGDGRARLSRVSGRVRIADHSHCMLHAHQLIPLVP